MRVGIMIFSYVNVTKKLKTFFWQIAVFAELFQSSREKDLKATLFFIKLC